MSLRKKPRLSEEEQALQNERNRIAREARLANIFPPQPPTAMSPPITPPKAQSPKTQSPKAQSRRTSPAQSPKTSSSSSSSSSSSASANMIEEERCALCLESLKNSNTYKTRCKHQYHEDCYDKIIDEKCPLCRASLDNDPRRPFRRPDSPYMDQLVQPDINPEIYQYIQTIGNDRLFDFALDITRRVPGITLRELQIMIGDVYNSYSDSERSSPASSGYSGSSDGSVYSIHSPASSVYSRNSDGRVYSIDSSPASSNSSRSSRRNRASSVSSISSDGSRASSNSSRSSRINPASSVSSIHSRGSRINPVSSNSSRSSLEYDSSHDGNSLSTSSSSNSNRVTEQIQTDQVVRNHSPPVSIQVDDDGEWIRDLYGKQNRGEEPESRESKNNKRKRNNGGKSKRKNNKKSSRGRKTSRSR